MTPSEICAADSIYVNGKIVTVDPNDSIVAALAVKGEQIVAVGSDDEIRELAGKSTELIDLAGKTVLPGINDSHTHAAMYGGSQPPLTLDLGFPAVKSIADIKEAVRARAADPQARRMDTGERLGLRLPRRVSGRSFPAPEPLGSGRGRARQSCLPGRFHPAPSHSEQRALELAGITRDSTTEPGSEIVMDSVTGEPTGDAGRTACAGASDESGAALEQGGTTSGRPDHDERLMNARGITSVTDAALGPGGTGFQGGLLGSQCISVYNDLHNEEALTLRVNILYLFGEYGAHVAQRLRGEHAPDRHPQRLRGRLAQDRGRQAVRRRDPADGDRLDERRVPQRWSRQPGATGGDRRRALRRSSRR